MPQLPSFVELPSFERFREDYLTDDEYKDFQLMLISDPKAGDVIAGTGGLRKIRFEDKRSGKGE
jgi:LAS superfamily LD-carboxypeptidase LdcB